MALLPGHNSHFLPHLGDVILRERLTNHIAAICDDSAVKIRPSALVFQVGIHSGKRAFHERDLGGGKVLEIRSLIVREMPPPDEV